MSRTLIIGYQDTDAGQDALELGAVLAEAFASPPLVATVVPWPEHLLPAEDLQRAIEADTAEMRAIARDRLAALDPETIAVADRSPARGLYELASTRQASLIVIGSAHRGPAGRAMLGSTGASLLHGAPCAVAVAPRGYAEDGPRTLLRVGVAFDGSPEASLALETGISLANRLHASFQVLTVAETPRYAYPAAFSGVSAGQYEAYEQQAKQRVLDLALAEVPDDLPVEGRLMTGGASLRLREATEQLDLLILGSRGYGPLRRTLLGSVAAKVMNEAACPALVLPRGMGLVTETAAS